MTEFVSNIRRQVGWFVILGIGAIVFILLTVSLRSDLFANKFYLSFSPPSASAFYVGQPIKYQGFTIGRIDNMELQSDGRVRISLRLLERYHPMLHEGAFMHLTREGLIGEQTLEISAGDINKPLITANQEIGYETAASVEQLLQDIKPAVANANTLLKELAELASWLNNPQSDIRQVTTRLNAISQDLTRENVGQLIANLSGALDNLNALTMDMKEQNVAKQLAAALAASSAILTDLRPLSEKIAKDGPESLEHINSLIHHVDKLSKSLDIVAADLSELTPELPGLARESRQAINEMKGILKSVRGSWLVGNVPAGKGGNDHISPPVMDMQP